MISANPWRKLFPATVLPFHEDLSIDEEDLSGPSGLASNGQGRDA
jgi:hypothetical protein